MKTRLLFLTTLLGFALLPAKMFAGGIVSANTSGATSICTGTSTTMTLTTVACTVGGGATLAYQWEESNDNGVGNPWANAVGGIGATTASYTSPVLSSNIYYRCKLTIAGTSTALGACATETPFVDGTYYINATVVTAATASTSSANPGVLITVNPLPTITTAATATTVCFSAGAQTTPLTYSATTNTPTTYSLTWSAAAITAGFVNVTNAALPASPITINVPAGAAAATYIGTLTVKNANTCVSSPANTFTLTINPLPTLFTTGGTATICSGATTNITLSGSTLTTVNYQLRNNAGNINVGSAVTGTGAALNLPTGALANTTTFNVLATIVATGCTQQMTGTVTVTVNQLPTITAQPTNQTVCSGSSVSFSVTATGAGLTYQWRKNGVNLINGGSISGALSATLTINPTIAGDVASAAAGYDVVVTGTCTPAVTSNRYSLSLDVQGTTAAAGPDQVVGTATATLAGNTISSGTGSWSTVSGTGVVTTASSPTSGVTGLTAGASSTFRWTSTNGTCTNSDDIIITRYCQPTGPGTYYLTNVTFAGINNTTGYANYTFYSSPTASVNNGCTYSISLIENSFGDNYRVWIDYNKDGTFVAGESVFSGTFSGNPGTASGTITIPGTGVALPGTTRMRVIHGYNAVAAGAACTNPASYGEVEDYLVVINGVATTPANPTSTAATAVICNGFNANWSAVSGATNYTLETSSNNFTSILATYNLGNITTYAVTGLAANTLYYYRLKAANCSGTLSTGYSLTQSVTTATACYCSVTGANNYYITNVTFAGINNNTGAGAGGYTFYSSPTANVNIGCGFTLSLAENSFADYYRVWIDYNNNGTFEDAESVMNGQYTGNPGVASALINIPGSATVGTTRMRVIQNTSTVTVTADCTNTNDEVEDYVVNISAATAPVAPTATAATSVICNGFNANWNTVTGATSYKLDVSTDPAFGSFAGIYNNYDIGNVTTYAVTGLSQSTLYYFRVRAANCTATSASSGNQSATTTNTVTTRTWVGPVTGTLDFNLASNWSPTGSPQSCDDIVMNITPSANITMNVSGVTSVNSINFTYSPTGNTTRNFTFAVNNNLSVSNAFNITNNAAGNGDHEIDLNISNNTNLTTGSFSSIVTGGAGSGGYVNHTSIGNSAGNAAGAVFVSNGNFNLNITGGSGNGNPFKNYVSVFGYLNIKGTTDVNSNCGRNAPNSDNNICAIISDNSPSSILYDGIVNIGTSSLNNTNNYPGGIVNPGYVTLNLAGTCILSSTSGDLVFKNDLNFGPAAYSTSCMLLDKMSFDKPAGSRQIVSFNQTRIDIYFPSNVNVGSANMPYVEFTGTGMNGLVNDFASILGSSNNYITVNNGATLDLGTKTFNCTLDQSTPSDLFAFQILNGGTLKLAGNSGGIAAGSNFPAFETTTLGGTSTVEYYSADGINQTVWATPTYGHLVISSKDSLSAGTGSTKTITANIDISGNLIINRKGIFDINTRTANHTGGATNTFTIGANGLFRLANNTGGQTGSNFPTAFNSYSFNPAGTVEYYGDNTLTQTVYAPITYGNLMLTNNTSGSGIQANKILTANVTGIAGNLTINPFATYQIVGFTSNSTGTGTFSMAANGRFRLSGSNGGQTGSNFPSSFSTYIFNPISITDYYGGAQNIWGGVNYGHLNLLNAGLKTAPSGDLTIKGNFTNTSPSTFAHNSGRVLMNMASTAQTFAGVTYYQLEVSGGGVKYTNNNLGFTDSTIIVDNLKIGTSGTALTLAGANSITLKSTAAKTARIDQIDAGATIAYPGAGRFIVERYIPMGRKWRFLSAPTRAGQTIRQAWQESAANASENLVPYYGTQITADAATNTFAAAIANGFDSISSSGPSMKSYTAGVWTGIPNTTSTDISNNIGFMTFVRGDRTIQGFAAGTAPAVLRSREKVYDRVATPASVTVPANTFVSIGNPYASAINMRSISKTAGVKEFFYLWDPKLSGSYGLGAYQTLSLSAGPGSDYVITPGGGSYVLGGNENLIRSGAAFFVEGGAAGGTLSFDETNKVADSVDREVFFAPDRTENLRWNLYAANTTPPMIVDGVMVNFGDKLSNKVDDDDARKFSGNNESIALLTDKELLAIERRHTVIADDTLQLNMKRMRVQNYQWQVNISNMVNDGRTAFLIDKYLQTSTPLDLNGITTVDFTLENIPGSYDTARFMIVFKQTPMAALNISLAATRALDSTIDIAWSTENEKDIRLYEIEKSADGTNFTTFATTTALSNAGATANYTGVDSLPFTPDNYYRIKATRYGLVTAYSPIVSLKSTVPGVNNGFGIYPNPVTDKTMNIEFGSLTSGNYKLQLSNSVGQIIYSSNEQITAPNMSKTIKLNNATAAGIYYLSIIDANGKSIVQQVVIK